MYSKHSLIPFTRSTPKLPLLQLTLLASLMLFGTCLTGQTELPSVYSNLQQDGDSVFFMYKGKKIPEVIIPAPYTLEGFRNPGTGTKSGLIFDFKNDTLQGTLYYGFIPYGDSKHPKPVFFRQSTPVVFGKTRININPRMSGRYDMIGWTKSGKGTIGYRVVDNQGNMVHDGVVGFKGTGPFEVDNTIVEGPFVAQVTDVSAIIRFELNEPASCGVVVRKKRFKGDRDKLIQEVKITDLKPNTTYEYTVEYGDNQQTYSFTTAPKPGYNKEIVFAYASDSRSGQGGGERNITGANAYIMGRIMALATQKGANFMQFSGDLIDGYVTDPGFLDLQYANWKKAIQPWAHYLPVYVSMGNHEVLMRIFSDRQTNLLIDRFPFETESAEAIFNKNFTLPENGPESEDNMPYDPDPNKVDFPSYKENVYFYTYGNVAMIVLNSNYFYAPATDNVVISGGNIHAYLMDGQMKWLKETLQNLENDRNISHVFVTQHTPAFPNGGHVADDMWYNGDNSVRPYVNGVPAEKGILERRDEYLNLLVNESSKVRAILTGDEHNYARTKIGSGMAMYPKDWKGEILGFRRSIWQINNGAAGAPYYAQELTPWTDRVEGFTTQNALVFIKVKNLEVEVEVVNPDTLELVDSFPITINE